VLKPFPGALRIILRKPLHLIQVVLITYLQTGGLFVFQKPHSLTFPILFSPFILYSPLKFPSLCQVLIPLVPLVKVAQGVDRAISVRRYESGLLVSLYVRAYLEIVLLGKMFNLKFELKGTTL